MRKRSPIPGPAPRRRRHSVLQRLLPRHARRARRATEWVTQQELDADLGHGRD